MNKYSLCVVISSNLPPSAIFRGMCCPPPRSCPLSCRSCAPRPLSSPLRLCRRSAGGRAFASYRPSAFLRYGGRAGVSAVCGARSARQAHNPPTPSHFKGMVYFVRASPARFWWRAVCLRAVAYMLRIGFVSFYSVGALRFPLPPPARLGRSYPRAPNPFPSWFFCA